MVQPFILDENQIQFGLSVNPGVNPSSLLIQQILANHHPLYYSQAIWDKYLPKLSVLMSQFPNFAKLFYLALVDPDIGVRVEAVPTLPDDIEQSIKDAPDLPFVRLAAAVDSGIILATEDPPLRTSVKALGLHQAYNFHILSSEEALPFSGPDN